MLHWRRTILTVLNITARRSQRISSDILLTSFFRNTLLLGELKDFHSKSSSACSSCFAIQNHLRTQFHQRPRQIFSNINPFNHKLQNTYQRATKSFHVPSNFRNKLEYVGFLKNSNSFSHQYYPNWAPLEHLKGWCTQMAVEMWCVKE